MSFRKGIRCSCTALANFGLDVVSVGDDGRIALLTGRRAQPVRVIGEYSKK